MINAAVSFSQALAPWCCIGSMLVLSVNPPVHGANTLVATHYMFRSVEVTPNVRHYILRRGPQTGE